MDEQATTGEQDDLLDLTEIMQRFGVQPGQWSNLGTIEAAQPGMVSVLIAIDGQQYILRQRTEGLINEDTNFRYAFRAFLRQQGIPIPTLWLTATGEAAVAIGEDFFELEQALAGEPFSSSDPRSLEWTAAAGAMLAQIHQASRRYTGPQNRWPPEVHIGAVVQGYLNLARARAEQSEIAAVGAALANWADQWEAVLPAAMLSIGATRGLPELHIHGDYHPLNLRFGPSAVSAVYNWEAARWEKRLFELASALFSFSALEWQPANALTRPLVKRGLDPERARLFLQAYADVYPPITGEAAALGDALTLVAPIVTINGPLEDIFFTPHGVDESLIDDVMDRLAWAASLPAWLGRVRRALAEMWV